ncbi:methyltransferase domain-containing protein [Candidatus Woesearchaeota archaeon]|nr:methyltransferase domain-containing protein [Candidatus Woesearchaeota archaeon]MBW3016344.1 methyltransferase domain-containing protein [Candidatus Woesearchaeota archaeon]
MSHILEFFKHPIQISSLFPSTRRVAKKMAAPIDFELADRIVELGPGNGIVTRVLLENMKPTAKLTAVEINNKFYQKLKRIKDKRLYTINGNAFELRRYVQQADYVVSGIPIILLSEEQRTQLFKGIQDVMKYGCIQLCHQKTGQEMLERHFKHVERKRVWLNLPPAYVCTASNATYRNAE